MDFAFFAIAFNIKKMDTKSQKQGNIPTNGGQSVHFNGSYKPKKRILGNIALIS